MDPPPCPPPLGGGANIDTRPRAPEGAGGAADPVLDAPVDPPVNRLLDLALDVGDGVPDARLLTLRRQAPQRLEREAQALVLVGVAGLVQGVDEVWREGSGGGGGRAGAAGEDGQQG